MTEYSTSSEAIREFQSAQERTAYWVGNYTRNGPDHILMSPSAPPSVVSDADVGSGGSSESDTLSIASIPPRMVLHFEDGRPDIPISHDYPRPSRTRPRVPVPTAPNLAVEMPHAPSSRGGRSRAGTHPPPRTHPRSGQTLSYMTIAPDQADTPRPPVTPPRSPENIVVLPSTDSEQSKHIVSRAITPPPQSHSRTPTARTTSQPPRPIPDPSTRNAGGPVVLSPSPRHAFSPSQAHTLPRNHSPGMMYSQSQPLPLSTSGGVRYLEQQAAAQARPGSQLPYNYSPPAIIYAPSRRAKPNYAPPAIVYSPPTGSYPMAGRYPAPGMAHSQSVPVTQPGVFYPPSVPAPSKQRSHRSNTRSQHSHQSPTHPQEGSARSHHSHHSSTHHHEGSNHNRSLSRGRAPEMVPADHPSSHAHSRSHKSGSRHRTHSSSRSRQYNNDEDYDDDDAGSVSSNGTYYILPTPGQKVQIIVPNSGSVYTASSTTKSAHSPQSAHSGSYKKPFFQRIFHMPKFSTPSVDSRGSSGSKGSQGRRLQRRHTFGGAHIQRPSAT